MTQRTYKPRKTATLNIRLAPEVKLIIEQQAARREVSISTLTEEVIVKWIRTEKLGAV